jgi:UV damage repair endonuclease
MVLDIHHHAVNNPDGTDVVSLWPRIVRTWALFGWNAAHANEPSLMLPPKIHASSPKSESDPRGHADNVDPGPLLDFLRSIARSTPAVDVMIEAKRKDEALLRLMADLRELESRGEPVRVVGGACAEIP